MIDHVMTNFALFTKIEKYDGGNNLIKKYIIGTFPMLLFGYIPWDTEREYTVFKNDN